MPWVCGILFPEQVAIVPCSGEGYMPFLFSDSNESGQSFLEYALIILLIAIVVLAILLILGDDIRVFVIELWDKALRLISGQ
jgi:Flp pilus assembly pilin Flp